MKRKRVIIFMCGMFFLAIQGPMEANGPGRMDVAEARRGRETTRIKNDRGIEYLKKAKDSHDEAKEHHTEAQRHHKKAMKYHDKATNYIDKAIDYYADKFLL